MEPSFLGLRTVAYKVDNLQKACDWYAGILNMEPYFNEPYYVGFNISGFELGLIPDEVPAEVNKADGVLAYWGVNNIQESYRSLIEKGAEIHEEPNSVGGDLMVASVKDPWGNIIGLIYNPEFKITR